MEEVFHHGKKGLMVRVINNNVDGAISRLKRLLNQEGVNRELRRRRYYEKPTTRRRRERAEARIRWIKKKESLDPFK
jgi:small subunit ribosomal protein S21